MNRLYLLVVTTDGHAKRTLIEDKEFKLRHRGTKGARSVKNNSSVGGATVVGDSGEVLIVTERGYVLRLKVEEIAVISRLGQGGKIINLEKGDKVVAVVSISGKG